MPKKEHAVEQVLAAWTIEGRSPSFHRQQKELLRGAWPSLWIALTKLEQADKEES